MSRDKAYSLAEHYLLGRPARQLGATFNSDNQVEVRVLVDEIIDCAKAEVLSELREERREASARANGMTYP